MPLADWTAYITLRRKQGRTTEAIEAARRAVRQHPGLLRVLEQLLWGEAQVDEALATYEEAARKGLLDAAARLEGAGA
ncbi:tetratricopeptide repeat protein, partial [Escherichia coli]|nr:tetratricopeptide repeat protein [Escherichia coli]